MVSVDVRHDMLDQAEDHLRLGMLEEAQQTAQSALLHCTDPTILGRGYNVIIQADFQINRLTNLEQTLQLCGQQIHQLPATVILLWGVVAVELQEADAARATLSKYLTAMQGHATGMSREDAMALSRLYAVQLLANLCQDFLAAATWLESGGAGLSYEQQELLLLEVEEAEELVQEERLAEWASTHAVAASSGGAGQQQQQQRYMQDGSCTDTDIRSIPPCAMTASPSIADSAAGVSQSWLQESPFRYDSSSAVGAIDLGPSISGAMEASPSCCETVITDSGADVGEALGAGSSAHSRSNAGCTALDDAAAAAKAHGRAGNLQEQQCADSSRHFVGTGQAGPATDAKHMQQQDHSVHSQQQQQLQPSTQQDGSSLPQDVGQHVLQQQQLVGNAAQQHVQQIGVAGVICCETALNAGQCATANASEAALLQNDDNPFCTITGLLEDAVFDGQIHSSSAADATAAGTDAAAVPLEKGPSIDSASTSNVRSSRDQGGSSSGTAVSKSSSAAAGGAPAGTATAQAQQQQPPQQQQSWADWLSSSGSKVWSSPAVQGTLHALSLQGLQPYEVLGGAALAGVIGYSMYRERRAIKRAAKDLAAGVVQTAQMALGFSVVNPMAAVPQARHL